MIKIRKQTYIMATKNCYNVETFMIFAQNSLMLQAIDIFTDPLICSANGRLKVSLQRNIE